MGSKIGAVLMVVGLALVILAPVLQLPLLGVAAVAITILGVMLDTRLNIRETDNKI